MKKIKLLSVLLICVFGFIASVNAVEPRVIDNPITNSANYDFTVEKTELFDFSKVSFSTDVSGVTITGNPTFKKIYNDYYTQCPANDESCVLGIQNHFTAYCLDGNKKYPEYEELYTELHDAEEANKVLLFRFMTIYQVLKECKEQNCTLFDDLDGVTTFGFINGSEEFTIDTPSSETLANFDLGETDVTSYITEFYVMGKGSEIPIRITAEDLSTALGTTNYNDGKYAVTFQRDDFSINHYTQTSMPTELMYNKALWIIEHSYPNLSLDIALNKAGVSLNELRASIATLENIEDNVENASAIDTLVQNYVYATTQYAIWSTMGEYFEMKISNEVPVKAKLGSSITNNTLLDKLYKYYLEDREEYENYGTTPFNNKFNITLPASGKELFKTTTDAYIYGPYKINGTMLYTETINVSIQSPTTGVSLIDVAGNALTSIKDGGDIYLKVLKSSKPSTVKLNFNTTTAYVFASSTNRGKLFESESPIDQIVATGDQLSIQTINGNGEILLNPKTGVEDIGTIFLVALIAFTLGYLVLRLKPSPVKEI